MKIFHYTLLIPMAGLASFMLVGCGPSAGDRGVTPAANESGEGSASESGDGHNHGGWWCAEHGVPEKVCSLCSTDAAADFKAKGDWCDEHHRAKSQCFKCDPSLAEKFAKLYEAKVGHAPPKPQSD